MSGRQFVVFKVHGKLLRLFLPLLVGLVLQASFHSGGVREADHISKQDQSVIWNQEIERRKDYTHQVIL